MTEILAVSDLSVRFKKDDDSLYAVNNVTFSIEPGEIVGIVGESGCGKSVLVQSLLKLLPIEYGEGLEGSVMFDGEDLMQKTECELQKIRGYKIGMVFQNPSSSLNPTIKVGAQITEPMIIHKGYKKSRAKNEALELLRKVGVPNPKSRFDQYPYQLSGGLCQRVAIAMALSCSPKILIADEPTTSLDATIQAQVLDLISEINKDLKMTIILITHDLSIVANICDRVLVMYGGSIVEQGKTNRVLLSPQHPYTKSLLRSIPTINQTKLNRLVPIEGSFKPNTSKPIGCPFKQRCPHLMQICTEKTPPFFIKKQKTACWLLDERAKDV